MLITTKANIKQLLGQTSTDDDAYLVAIASAVSAEFEHYIDREVQATEHTAYFDVDDGQKVFSLVAYPVSAVASVNNDYGRSWGSSTLVDSDNYVVADKSGQLIIDRYGLVTGAQVLRVVYTGGLAATQAALQVAYPDLEHAARIQSAFYYKKKDRLGIAAESVSGSSISIEAKLELLPEVKSILEKYKRYAIR